MNTGSYVKLLSTPGSYTLLVNLCYTTIDFILVVYTMGTGVMEFYRYIIFAQIYYQCFAAVDFI